MAEKYVALHDEILSEDTFDSLEVYILDGLTVRTLDKLLVETCFGNYEEFITDHCIHPDDPQNFVNTNYPGVFGDSEHLDYNVGGPGTDGRFRDILNGKVTTVEVADVSGSREAPWGYRLRFFKLEDYAKQVRDRVASLNALLNS